MDVKKGRRGKKNLREYGEEKKNYRVGKEEENDTLLPIQLPL